MARKTKSDGYFIANGQPFKEKAQFEKNSMRPSQADEFLAANPTSELKYMVAKGYICIDADEIGESKRLKYPLSDYPLSPIEYVRGICKQYNIKPYCYNTKNENRMHFWFKVQDNHQGLIETLKLNSSGSKLYPGVDTRGYRRDGKNVLQGAVYLNSPNKERGGRPIPSELIEGIRNTCFAPIGALLPHNLRPTLKSGLEWESTSFKLAKDMKYWGLTEQHFQTYCQEQARIHRESHSTTKCATQWKNAPLPEPKAHAIKGLQLYRFKDNFYTLDNEKYVLMDSWDIEQAIAKTKRFSVTKEGETYIDPWNRQDILEKAFMLKVESKELVFNDRTIVFKNRYFNLDTREIREGTIPHINIIPWELRDLGQFSSQTMSLHKEYMTSILGSKEDNLDKWLSIYLDIGLAMSPRLITQTMRLYIGDANNGKSKLLEIIGEIVGEDNATSVGFSSLVSDPHASANLLHKTANIVGDVNSNYTNEVNVIKMVTAGDLISSNAKNKQAFPFRPYAYNIGAANKVPLWQDDDGSGALERRLKYTHFKEKVQKDINFDLKFKTKDHIELFIALAVRTLKMFLSNSLEEYQDQELLDQWRLHTDPIRRFKRDYESGKWVPYGEVLATGDDYDLYKAWCYYQGLSRQITRFRFEEKYKEIK